jgi:hypothetical protein
MVKKSLLEFYDNEYEDVRKKACGRSACTVMIIVADEVGCRCVVRFACVRMHILQH